MGKNPVFMAEYEELEDEFALLEELLKPRRKANMIQEDVARRINTKAPAVAGIESGGQQKTFSFYCGIAPVCKSGWLPSENIS